MNVSCAICSDMFMPSHDMYMTPCGHAFHHACLTQWFARSKTCPQCRNKCNTSNIIKIYFNIVTNLDATLDTGSLLQKVDNLELQNRESNTKIKKLEEERDKIKSEQNKLTVLYNTAQCKAKATEKCPNLAGNHYRLLRRAKNKTIEELKHNSKNKDFLIQTYKEEARVLQNDRQLAAKLTVENKELLEKVNMMSTIQNTLKATANEVEEMLKNHPDSTTLAVMVASLKREVKAIDNKKNEFRDMWKLSQGDLHAANQRIKELEEKCANMDIENTKLDQSAKELDKALMYETDESLDKTPKMLKQTCTEDLNLSTPIAEKVEKIVNSGSPYLNIKGSNILAMHTKMRPRNGLKPLANGGSQSATTISKTQSDLTDRVSIFKKPRIAVTRSMAMSDLENGSSGSKEKKENLPIPLPGHLPLQQDLKTKLRKDKLRYLRQPTSRMEMTTLFSPIQRNPNDELMSESMEQELNWKELLLTKAK